MKNIGMNELRTLFREFYVSKGHYPRKSFPLVPERDTSLLLINSGMAPLKPYFAGLDTPPSKRMTTCQKCIRTGDLDNVGHTARHGTFFEMLGSFSFGDYFKKESLIWGWEFITEVLEMPVDKLWASIYEDDDDACGIWANDVGIDPERIVRLGKDDNFWEIGIGPCGPCSEVYFDRGEEYGCDSPDCKPGCECDRYVEFWNHVFTQFNRDAEGNYTPLAHPNIDTGLGLERLACILQGVDSIFDVDAIKAILTGVTEISGTAYGEGTTTDISIRIITDHIRSVTFMIGDGILPSNEGRGYVLRRLLRRAAVHGRKLGIDRLFLNELAGIVIDLFGDEYEELREKQEYIKKIIDVEEERFSTTIDQGQELLNAYITEMKDSGSGRLPGDKAFKLYDTHGFNIELTREILGEHGLTIDEKGFEKELQRQQETSRKHMKLADSEAWSEDDRIFKGLPATVFTGYETLTGQGRALLLMMDGKPVDEAGEGAYVNIVLDSTPFYAESGGQAGDVGELTKGEFKAKVTGVTKIRGCHVHEITIIGGVLKKGDELDCSVDPIARNRTRRNHSATHLLHKALRLALGEHVSQAGSAVDSKQLRFDFTHYERIGADKLVEIEEAVNSSIDSFLPVCTEVMSLEDAKARGAIALFDEKYGDKVRVVSMGDFSTELCGGTHVDNSGEIGAFHIISESSVGSGVRRIEAITGTGVLEPLRRDDGLLGSLGKLFKAPKEALAEKAEELISDLRDSRKAAAAVKKNRMGDSLTSLIDGAKEFGGGKAVCHVFEDLDAAALREMADRIRAEVKDVITVLASKAGGKGMIITAVSDSLQEKGFHAGKLIKEIAAAAGGGGGGKADIAQAGAKDPSKLDDAMDVAMEQIEKAAVRAKLM